MAQITPPEQGPYEAKRADRPVDTSGHSTYDVIVIGAGQAGPSVAGIKAEQGKRVALIEMDEVGGTCLNHGCRPTKALRASATAAHRAREAGTLGITTGPVSVDFAAVTARVRAMITQMRRDLYDWIAGIDNLDLIKGAAQLETSPATGEHRVHVGGRTLTAREIYLDVGARASLPSIPGLDHVPYLTEVELLHLTELPSHLVIVGGGYVGLEFGQMFRRLGAEVTMLVGNGVAGREDPDVADLIAETLSREGVRIIAARPSSVETRHGAVRVCVDGHDDLRASHLLVATGRVSNADQLGAQHGLRTDTRGFFTIGPRFETSVAGVWALGDVNGHGAFTHTAYQDGQIVLDPNRTVEGRVTSYALFTDPPLGRVGMSTAEARKSGRRVLKAEVPMARVTRAVLEGETTGIMRILVDADTQEFLGATIFGPQADELVQVIGFAMQAGITYPTVRDALPIHPTVAEYIPFALTMLKPVA